MEWDLEYKSLKWNYLENLEEIGRNSLIVSILSRLPKGFDILDLGCGQGTLFKLSQHLNFNRYIGIDISEIAIELANKINDERAKFICMDLTKYIPEQRFDIIIFNEVLYYTDDPLKVVKMFRNFLKNEGIILISMWNNKQRNNKIWKLLKKNFNVKLEYIIKENRSRRSWIIKAIS
jgi:SAM-dependent methyltransferase